jgi:D-psicose/D-tagatose/L-ribulose 3-epimerase
MRIGFCTNLIATGADGTGIEWIDQGKESGFDYVELPLAQMADLDDTEFSLLTARVKSSGLKCEACNNFFPANIRLTGEGVDQRKIDKYLGTALERAARLGVQVIVFGSPRSRHVPEGYPMDKARSQLVALLRHVDRLVRAMGITVAIEPLCRLESNIINTAAEGLELAQYVDRKNIRLLVDYYHLVIEKERPEIVLRAGKLICHTHFANPVGRTYPAEAEASYVRFLTLLNRSGYDARMSVEAYSHDFGRDGKHSAEMLGRLVGEVQTWIRRPGTCRGTGVAGDGRQR